MKPLGPLLPFLVLFAFMAFIVMRNSRQRKESELMQNSLAPGSEVMMACGVFGTITAIDETTVTLQTAPKQVSTWDRRAVGRIVKSGDTANPQAPGTDADKLDSVASSTAVEPSSTEKNKHESTENE